MCPFLLSTNPTQNLQRGIGGFNIRSKSTLTDRQQQRGATIPFFVYDYHYTSTSKKSLAICRSGQRSSKMASASFDSHVADATLSSPPLPPPSERKALRRTDEWASLHTGASHEYRTITTAAPEVTVTLSYTFGKAYVAVDSASCGAFATDLSGTVGLFSAFAGDTPLT